MSHFTVLVIGDNPEEQLAPFQENNMGDCPEEYLKYICYPKGSRDTISFYSVHEAKKVLEEQYDPENAFWENPNAKWDWYTLGGRWFDTFQLKKGAKGVKGGGVGRRRDDVSTMNGRADQALKRDIDFDAMYRQAFSRASQDYDVLLKVYGGEPPPLDYTWEEARKLRENIDLARQLYNSQPQILKWSKTKEIMDKFGLFTSYEEVCIGKEAYCLREQRGAFIPFAVVKDGEWHEQGTMGWWGMARHEKDRDVWNREVENLIKRVPDDTLLSMYDCHI